MQRGYRAGMGKIAPWHAYTHNRWWPYQERPPIFLSWPIDKRWIDFLLAAVQKLAMRVAGGKIQPNDALFRVWNDSPYSASVCFNLDRVDGWNKFTTCASNCVSGAKQRWKTLCLSVFFPSFAAHGTMNKWMKTNAIWQITILRSARASNFIQSGENFDNFSSPTPKLNGCRWRTGPGGLAWGVVTLNDGLLKLIRHPYHCVGCLPENGASWPLIKCLRIQQASVRLLWHGIQYQFLSLLEFLGVQGQVHWVRSYVNRECWQAQWPMKCYAFYWAAGRAVRVSFLITL